MGVNMIAVNDGADFRKKLPGNIGEVGYYPSIFLFQNNKEQSVIEFNPEKDMGKSDSKAQTAQFDLNYDGLMKFLTTNGVKEPGSKK